MHASSLRWVGVAVIATLTVLATAAPSAAKTEIHFWHAMGGQLGETVNELVRQFNQSQSEYEVKPLHKGTYPEVLTGAIAAYRRPDTPGTTTWRPGSGPTWAGCC